MTQRASLEHSAELARIGGAFAPRGHPGFAVSSGDVKRTVLRHGDVLTAISDGLVALLKEFYGRGPTRAKSYYEDDLVVCVLRGGFSRVEQTLLEGGRGAAVIQQRVEFQELMRERFEAVIERATGRQVIGFMSGNQQHPDADPCRSRVCGLFCCIRTRKPRLGPKRNRGLRDVVVYWPGRESSPTEPSPSGSAQRFPTTRSSPLRRHPARRRRVHGLPHILHRNVHRAARAARRDGRRTDQEVI